MVFYATIKLYILIFYDARFVEHIIFVFIKLTT